MESLSNILSEPEPAKSIKLELRKLEWELEYYDNIHETSQGDQNVMQFANSKIRENYKLRTKLLEDNVEYLI